jgi:protein-arginine kinase activator protein McsA
MDWDLERAKKKPAWKRRSKLKQDSTPCETCGETYYKFELKNVVQPICIRCYRQIQQDETDFTIYEGRIVTDQNIKGFGGTGEPKRDTKDYSTKYLRKET